MACSPIAIAESRVKNRFGNGGNWYPLSFSVGILTCGPAEEAHIEELLERADKMMYREKRLKSERMAFAEGPSSAA